MPSFPENSKELVELLKNTKCVILKFSASWCGPCQNETFLKNYHDLKHEFETNQDVLFLEFDVDDHEDFINEKKLYNFNISAVPTIKIFHFNKQMNEYKGIPNMSNIKKDINTILAKV